MRIGDAHLTYCLNVHPGATGAEVDDAVFRRAPEVFAEVARQTGASGPWGVGLWLSRQVLRELRDPAARRPFRARLRELGLYVFTLNGFPFGAFHGRRIKDEVYRPDWAEDKRMYYTMDLARFLAGILPPGLDGSISTVPVTYSATAEPRRIARAVALLAETALELRTIADRTGHTIRVALEPEPDCLVETVAGAARFLEEKVFRTGCELLVNRHGQQRSEAEEILRRHLGICLDTVHEVVVNEDPIEALEHCRSRGVAVPKVQLGAALGCRSDFRAALRPFTDQVYLHQTRVVTGDGERRFRDLDEALDAQDDTFRDVVVHYHLPLSQRGDLAGGSVEARSVVTGELLAKARECGTEHFEVEVYTLNLMPGAAGRSHQLLAADLAWVAELFARHLTK